MSNRPPCFDGFDAEDFFEVMREHYTDSPDALRTVYPRSIRAPRDFYSPEWFAISACALAEYYLLGHKAQEDVTNTALHVIATRLMEYKVPTYFPSAPLLEALLHTDPPQDMALTDLRWPMPAMLFMLPKTFSRAYFGEVVPFVCTANIPPHYGCRSPLILHGQQVSTIEVTNAAHPESNQYMIGGCVLENGLPVHYANHGPIHESLAVKDTLISTVTYYMRLIDDDIPDQVHDVGISHRMTNLVINLIMAMTARPELIGDERLLRSKQVHAGRVIHDALWSPRMIGENFGRSVYGDQHGGSHASPSVHWRRGHWRNQRKGPALSIKELIWIEPVQVGLCVA